MNLLKNLYAGLYSNDGVDASALKPTAALDGLRGFAAFSVFLGHILFSYTFAADYGYGESETNSRWFQLPFIKLAWAGHPMVVVFFVVGGYVMSIKPYKLLHSKQHASFLNTLTSSVFRRSFRFYLPVLVVTFINLVIIYLGLWEYSRQFTNDKNYISYDDGHIEQPESLWAALTLYANHTYQLTNVFYYYNKGFLQPYYPELDHHLWTIIVEYRSGLLLAMALLALARCRIRIRIFFMFILSAFVASWERWELVCFFLGSTLCEIDLITGAGNPANETCLPVHNREHEGLDEEKNLSLLLSSSSSSSSSFSSSSSSCSSDLDLDSASFLPTHSPIRTIHHLTPRIRTTLTRALPTTAFLTGLYLLSAPALHPSTTPLYTWLPSLTPHCFTDPKRLPYTAGALLVVWALMRSPALRAPFLSPVAQLLGRISFALYVVHGPMIQLVGFSVTPTLWKYVTGMASEVQWGTGFVLGGAVLVPSTLVVAYWFYAVVEVWSVQVCRRVEALCWD